MKFILLLIIFARIDSACAQYANTWIWGDKSNVYEMSFNNNPPSIRTVILNPFFNINEANAMISDENGQLLFYTNGNYVWNKNYTLMPDGNDLIGMPGHPDPVLSTHKGTVIVPLPGSETKYYIFSLTAFTGGAGSNQGLLYYSIVDMELENGLGNIDPTHKGIYLASGIMEGIYAVAGNRCNIWLLTRSATNGNLCAYEITESGINSTPVNSPVKPAGTYIGDIKVSYDRTKILLTDINYHLLDFNPTSGMASNLKTILPAEQSNIYLGYKTPEFSVNSKKLYAYSPQESSIAQFDATLNTGIAIYGSRKYIVDVANLNFEEGGMKLGPDGRIYINRNGNIDCINYPNLTGIACGYELGFKKNITLGASVGPNIVPFIDHDTFYTSKSISAGCFANINQLVLHAGNGNTDWNYLWSTGGTNSTLRVETSDTYWVTYHSPSCNFNTDTFKVSFRNGILPDIHIQNACKNYNNGKAWASTYPGDTVTYHYLWQNSNRDTLSLTDTLQNVPSGNYTLHVATAHCDTILSLFIPKEEHKVSFLTDSIICQGTELNFTNTSDTSFTQFHWDFGDKASSPIPNPSHIYKQTGIYRVALMGFGDICKDSAHKMITVDSLLSGSFLTESDSFCAGAEAITFYPQTDSSARSLHWQFGDGSEMTSGNEEKINHAYEQAGTTPVTLTSHFRACPDTSFTDTVYIYPVPKLNLGADTALCLNGSPVVLKNLQASPNEVYYNFWSTGDTSASLKIVHPGIYTLTIKTEPLGCSNTESIKITKDCYIDILNAFTPNDDGENDYFFPRQLLSSKVTQFKMQIFNRWGQIIFETNKINGRGWDGKFNNKPQPEGVYVYRIDVEIDGNHTEYYQGNVTLLR